MVPTKIKKRGKKARLSGFLMGDTLELFANVGRSAQRRLDANPQPGPSGIAQTSGPRRALVSNDRAEDAQSQETHPQRKKKVNTSPRVPEAPHAPAITNPLTLGLNKEELKAFKTEQRRRYCSWWKKHDRVLPVWARMLTLDQLAEISNLETIVRELFDDREPTKKDFLKYYREVKSCKSPNDEVLTRAPLNRLRINGEWRLFFVDDVRIMKKEYEKGNVEAYFFRPVDDEEQEAPDPEIAAPLPVEPIVEPEIQAAAEEAEEEEVWQPPVEEVDLERFRRDSNILELLQNLGKEGPRLEKVISSSFNCWKEGGTTAILRQLRWTHKEEPKLQPAAVEEQPQTFELSSDSEESLLEELQRNEPIPLLPTPAPVVSSTQPRSSLPPRPKWLPPSRKRIEQLIAQLGSFPETNPSPPKRASSQLPTMVMPADQEKKKSPPKKKVKTQRGLLNRFVKQTSRPKPRRENEEDSKEKARETRPISSKGHNLVEEWLEKCQNAESAITASSQPEVAASHQKEPEKTQNNHQMDTLPATTPTSTLESTVEPEVAPAQQQSMEEDEDEAALAELHSSQGQDAKADPNIHESFKNAKAKETRPMSSKSPNPVEELLEKSQNADPANYGSPPLFDDFVQPEEPTKMEENQQTEKRPDTTPASLLLTMLESAAEPEGAPPPPEQQPMETDEEEARVEAALAELHSSQDQSAIADPPNTHDSSESGTSSHVIVSETPPSVEETPVQVKVEPDQQHSPYNDSVEVVEVPAPAPIVILDETMPDSQELFANMGTAQPQNNALVKADQRFLQQSFTRAIQTLQQTLIETSSETESGVQSTPLKENTQAGVIETSVESEASPNIQVVAKKPQEGSKPRLARPILTEFLNRWNGKETIGDENVPIESASFSEKL